MRRRDAFLGQPLTNHTLGCFGVIAVGIRAELRTQAQKQLLSHGVVAVLVDVTNDFSEVWREGAGQDFGAFRDGTLAILPQNTAAQFFPDRANGACGIRGVVKQRQVGLRVAAIAQLTRDGNKY